LIINKNLLKNECNLEKARKSDILRWSYAVVDVGFLK